MRYLDSDHQALPSLQPLEQNMLREAYERAGSVARSMGVPRAANPYVVAADQPCRYAADAERLRILGEHWWRGWDSAAAKGKGTSPTTPQARQRIKRT